MVCAHCSEKTNICPYCSYGIDVDEPLEEFSVCPKCGKEIDSCPYCGCELKNAKPLEYKSVLIQKVIGYVALFLIFLGIIYLFFIVHI